MLPRWLPALVLLGACNGGDAGPDAAPPDANPICLEAAEHDDLPWLQENVFTPSCSRFTACHQGRALMAGELSLEEEDTFAQLVGVESSEFGKDGWVRVVPGDPENSYLMVALGQYPGPLTEAGTMPYNSPLLCQEMRDAIERWIEGGALETPADPPDAGPYGRDRAKESGLRSLDCEDPPVYNRPRHRRRISSWIG
jgi:hypothetical protein